MGVDCKSIGKCLHRFKSYSAQDVSKMLEDAEKNAFLDKSRKSFVNITYELDNLLAKMQKVFEFTTNLNLASKMSLSLIMNSLISCYFENKFQTIYSKILKDLKFCAKILILEFLKKELLKEEIADKNGNIIDIDLAEDA